jgi:hypothetical protein
MPKKYEYFIVLTTNIGVHQASFYLYRFFDHPIDSNDIVCIENAGKNGRVVNWKLLKVTGTFTYLFNISTFRPGQDQSPGETGNRAVIKEFDHRVTTATIEADFEKIRQDQYKRHSTEGNLTLFKEILSFQEIPDD